MIKAIAVAFALALASAAQAMPLSPMPESDALLMTIRQGCGLGYQRVGGRCVRGYMARAVRRCARGERRVRGRCVY